MTTASLELELIISLELLLEVKVNSVSTPIRELWVVGGETGGDGGGSDGAPAG